MNSRKESGFTYIVRTAFCYALSILIAIAFITIVSMGLDTMQMAGKAKSLKADLGELTASINEKDFERADVATDKLDSTVDDIDELLAGKTWRTAAKMPVVGEYVGAVDSLVDIVKIATGRMIKPALTVIQDYPLDSIKVGDEGFNTYTMEAYIGLLEELNPAINDIIGYLDDINIPDSLGGKVAQYTDKMAMITDAYAVAEDYLPLLKAFLGGGSDRTYLLAAQNSTEIRAGGGFPGSIGTITIVDGVLTIGDFNSVYDVLPYGTPASVGPSELEDTLFGNWMHYPRDASFNPDFERVAQIWAKAYGNKSNTNVDGVISLTPTIIQRLLSYMGEVQLSDGTVLNGENATQMLQHDLYYKYFNNASYTDDTNDVVDALFAETAKTTMSRLVDDFDLNKIAGYLSVFNAGAEDRTIMMWMADETEQQYVRDVGCSGGLNDNPENPEIGVYISGSDPCKLGWYVNVNTQIGEAQVNEDGTRTYDVTVTVENTIDNNTIKTAGTYILGSYEGAWRGYIHLFAPAGGTISDVKADSNGGFRKSKYENLEVAYNLNVMIYPQKSMNITYKVTTAEGVTTVPEVSMTPTLQGYR